MAVVSKLVQKQERDNYIQKEKQQTKQQTKTQNTQNRKLTYKTRKQNKVISKKHMLSNLKIQREANNNETAYCTEPTYSYVTIDQR